MRGIAMSGFAKTVDPITKTVSGFKSLLKDSSGGTGIMMGLTAIPVALAFGVAFDTVMINREQTMFYQSVDNAAIAIAANERSMFAENATAADIATREAEMKVYATKYLNANYSDILKQKKAGPKDKNGKITTGESNIRVTVKLTGQKVDLNAQLDVPTPFMSVLNPVKGYNKDKITLTAKSTVQRAMRPIEIAFVLDTTGSMANDMSALKTAANKMLSTLYSDSGTSKNMASPFIRVSLVPFSATVRLDPAGADFNMAWFDTTGVNPLSRLNFTASSGWHNFMAWGRLKSNATNQPLQWNGCVEARTPVAPDGVNYITSDTAPNPLNPHSLFPVYFNPDSPSWYKNTTNAWFNASGTQQSSNVSWNNPYIGSSVDYKKTAALDPALLAPNGSKKTGFDDSGIGNTNTVFNDRWKNPAKYDGKAITPETITPNGNGADQNAGPWDNCTISSVVPITHQRAKIETGIAAMKASGNTNIAEGLAWGMRTISPGAPFTQVEGATAIPSEAISPYNGVKWQKIVLLMSDGENTAGSGYTDTGTLYNSYGSSNVPTGGTPALNRYGTTNANNAPAAIDAYTSTMCNTLKANGVTIYSIGFRLDNPILKACATSPAHYKFATSTTELVTYFDGIGRDVVNKMVYVSK
jgi:hypothetical protein